MSAREEDVALKLTTVTRDAISGVIRAVAFLEKRNRRNEGDTSTSTSPTRTRTRDNVEDEEEEVDDEEESDEELLFRTECIEDSTFSASVRRIDVPNLTALSKVFKCVVSRKDARGIPFDV